MKDQGIYVNGRILSQISRRTAYDLRKQLERWMYWTLPLIGFLSALLAPCFVLTVSNPGVNRLLIKPPDPRDPDSGNFPLGGIIADSDFMELELFGEFLGGHHLSHRLGLQR